MGTIYPIIISFSVVVGLSIVLMIIDHVTKKRGRG